MPRRTSASIEFGLEDVSAKEDSALQASGSQPVSNLEQVEQAGLDFPRYATCEHNFWFLDGTSSILPDAAAEAATGWWSLEQSNQNGVFLEPPVLTVSFTSQHASIGLTLTFFQDEWPQELRVQWFNGETLLSEQMAYPDASTYAIYHGVEGYTKLVLTFLSTNHPARFLRLTGIQYGITQLFGDSSLLSASIREELNPVSEEVSINTLHFKLHSSDAAFSLLNPHGIFAYLQQKQALVVTETVNRDTRPMGTFYLNEWSGENENTFTMDAIDAVGVLDGAQYMGGLYEEIPAEDLIADIVENAGFQYRLDGRLVGEKLSGWLPLSTRREALQQVALALCAAVDTSRSGLIQIFPVEDAPCGAIGRARKFQDGTLTLKPFVTGVEVLEHNYSKAEAAGMEPLFDGVLPPGEHVVTFNAPSYNLAVTGATLRAGHVNYAVLEVEAEGQVSVTGKRYVDATRIVGRYLAALPAGQKQNVLTVNSATLVSRGNSLEVAERVFQYHQQRLQQNFTFLLDAEQAGQVHTVETLYNQNREGTIEALEVDLTGGYLAKATITGA